MVLTSSVVVSSLVLTFGSLVVMSIGISVEATVVPIGTSCSSAAEIEIVDYNGFVKLCEKSEKVINWF